MAQLKRKSRVRCTALFDDDVLISPKKSPANSLSQAGSDVRTRHCRFELCPQTTQNTRKKSASFCMSCGQRISPSHEKAGSRQDVARAYRKTGPPPSKGASPSGLSARAARKEFLY